ncbi:MAG: hypothetical protein CEE38_12130 [Planctomycetes bacterium B3_Pla]|nr:MAG: hypothetical protein CEE38_12130 [Planctomycetes bacterium B3_Pla]
MPKKKQHSLPEVTASAENRLFVDSNHPNHTAKDITFKRCMFVRVGLKNATLVKLIFHRCVFEDCYLRGVKFQNVDFTGSTFKECNLERTRMDSCGFRYARFSKCLLNYDEILHSLPTEPNLAIGLLKSLRCNAIEMGNKDIADRLLSRQIDIEQQDLRKQIWGPTEYYKEHYKGVDRLLSLLKLVRLRISGLFWGHGLRIMRLFISAVLLIVLFASLYQFFGTFTKANEIVQNNFPMSLYLSTVTFTTLGHPAYSPNTTFTYILCAFESILGVVYLGFLVAALYRKLSR